MNIHVKYTEISIGYLYNSFNPNVATAEALAFNGTSQEILSIFQLFCAGEWRAWKCDLKACK